MPKALSVPRTALHYNLEVSARRFPDKAAIHYYGSTVTYADLARDVGLKQRGTIAEGNFADLTIFDPGTITRGQQAPVEDVPGGGLRFVRPVTGIDTTVINGQVAVSGGEYTGVNSGQLV